MARRQADFSWPPPPAPAPRCALCERQTPTLTEHHLIPKSRGRRTGARVADLPTALLCPPCHKYLHATFTNAELADHYASLNALREHEGVRQFLSWLRKQPPSKGVRVKRGG